MAYAEAGGDVLPAPATPAAPAAASTTAPASGAAPPATIAVVAQAARPLRRTPSAPASGRVRGGKLDGSSAPDDPIGVLAAAAGGGRGPTPIAPHAVRPADADGLGSLPFTGADAGIAALGGAILLALGLLLRRSTRDAPHRAGV